MSTPASRNSSDPAADTDRMQAAQLLSDAAAQGALSMNEYEDRLSRAYAAKTYDELFRLGLRSPRRLDHLPKGWPVPAGAVDAAPGHPERVRASRTVERAEAADHLRPLGRRRRGPPLRRLHRTRGRDPHYSIMGGQTILVPPEVNVDLRGIGAMGTFDHIPG